MDRRERGLDQVGKGKLSKLNEIKAMDFGSMRWKGRKDEKWKSSQTKGKKRWELRRIGRYEFIWSYIKLVRILCLVIDARIIEKDEKE